MKKRKDKNNIVATALIVALILIICGVFVIITIDKERDTMSQSSVIETSDTTTTSDISSNNTVSDNSSEEPEPSTSQAATSNISTSTSTEASQQVSSSSAVEIDTSASDINQWYLALANHENQLPSDYVPELKTIKNSNLKFHAKAVSALNSMIAAAKKDGVDLSVSSAYRSISRQTTLYNNEVNSYVQQGYELEEARQVAAMSVALPGTSEHHLGLAVDFYPVSASFENSAQFVWLKKNAEKYGFILRYPNDKQSITRIKYEPWHYRFVGKEHAEYINQHNLCLEEYIEYLKSKQSIS